MSLYCLICQLFPTLLLGLHLCVVSPTGLSVKTISIELNQSNDELRQ